MSDKESRGSRGAARRGPRGPADAHTDRGGPRAERYVIPHTIQGFVKKIKEYKYSPAPWLSPVLSPGFTLRRSRGREIIRGVEIR